MRKIVLGILLCLCACFMFTACNRNGDKPHTGEGEKKYVVTLVYNAPIDLPSQIGPSTIEIKKGEILNLPTYGSIEGGWFISTWEDESGNVVVSGAYNYDSDIKLIAQWSWSSVRV